MLTIPGRLWPVWMLTVVALSGCGGGGGDSSPAPTNPAPTPANNAPTVASANADQSATVGAAFNYDATQSGSTFNDADGDTLTYSVSFSPDANGFSANNGQISGTPQDAETTTVTITADDGNGGTADDSFTIQSAVAGAIAISGRVTYDSVPHNTFTNGLDYDNTQVLPVRGATVQLLDSGGSVLATDVTDSDGNYSLDVATPGTVRVRVRAEIAGFGSGWQMQVVDNTNSDALYVLDGNLVSSGNASSTRDLHAGSGWGGSSYTGTRAAAPFSMLDNIYDSMMFVRSADSNLAFPELTVHWSENNRRVEGATNIATGELSSSFFRWTVAGGVITSQIFILGAENGDPDEYDRHVIVHEWGHYFEANFSRSDSIGGPHSLGQRLDMRTAFGEGWGNAFSAMVLGDTVYRDASGSQQSTGFSFDIDRNNNGFDNPGWYSETSVQTILYDLFDSDDEGSTDTVSLGFGPIYQVMTNQQKDTPLFTSIFTFIAALKDANPGSAAAIDTLVANQDIVSATIDAEGSTETNNAGRSNVLPVYTDLPLDGATVNVCMFDAFGTNNKLSNYRFLKFTLPAQGNYRIVATRSPSGTVAGDPDFFIYLRGQRRAAGGSGVADSETQTVNLAAGDYVMALREFNITDNVTPRDDMSCYDVTLTTQ